MSLNGAVYGNVFERVDGRPHRARCALCSKEMGANKLATASHAKKHVREGKVTERIEFGYSGPRSVFTLVPQ